MSTDPKLPDANDEFVPESVTTPGGNVGALEDMIDETDADVTADVTDDDTPDDA